LKRSGLVRIAIKKFLIVPLYPVSFYYHCNTEA